MRDVDVRAAVRKNLEAKYGNDPSTRVVEEMGIWSGSVRVDMAVINGELCGLELKSDRDTLERLPFQADLYSRVFDRVELVVGSRHSDRAAEIIPRWWKVTIATMKDGAVHLRPMAGFPGRRNPALDANLVAQLLWKDEALAVLEAYGLVKGFKSKPIKVIHQRLAQELKLDVLRKEVRETLKRRPSHWLGQQVSNQLDMSVDAKLNPMLQPLWAGAISCDGVNDAIGPTMGQWGSTGMLPDGIRVTGELGCHVHPAKACCGNASTNEKVGGQGVTDVNRKTPRDP